MLRTRGAILDAAQRCIEFQGVKRTTMGDIASAAGVAKATLYNHFRAKDEVLAGLVQARVVALGERALVIAAGDAPAVPGQPVPETGLSAALRETANALATSVAVRRLAAEEPALLIGLTAPRDASSWTAARTATAGALTAAGAPAGAVQVDLVLRYLVHSMLWPAPQAHLQAGADVLAQALLGTPELQRQQQPPAAAVATAPPGCTGFAESLGWPG